MMSLSFSIGFTLCIALLGMVLLLYFYDPDIFISRYIIRTSKIKYFLKSHFGKSGKEWKEKWHELRFTIDCCQEAISKYVNKKNLSTLQDDETLKNLLRVYRDLLDMKENFYPEITVEQIKDIWHEIENIYFPDMDPYYQYDMEEVV